MPEDFAKHTTSRAPFRASRILMLTYASYQKFIRDTVKRLDLGNSELPVMQVLLSLEKAGIPETSQTTIANQCKRDKALITRAVRTLSERGLVVVEADQRNASQNTVRLTDAGREVAVEINSNIERWEESFLASFGDRRTQAEQVFALMDQMLEDQ